MKNLDSIISNTEKYFDILKGSNLYCWIAGGAIRDQLLGQKINDVDFFFSSVEDKNLAKDYLIKQGYEEVGEESETRYKFIKNNVFYDIIHTEGSTSPNKYISQDCDYTISSVAIDSNLRFYYHMNFFEDLEAKRLVRMKQTDRYIISNERRLRRLLEQGYSIDKDNLMKFFDDQDETYEYRKQFWSKE